MSERTVYYLAGEKAAELVRDYATRRMVSVADHAEFQESIGASGVYIGGTFDYAYGVTPPAGLKRYARPKKNRGDWRSDKSPEGRALAERFAALPRLPRAYELTEALKGGKGAPSFCQSYGHRLFEDAVVITALEGWVAPIDCTPIKASEYWLMVEAGEE